MTLGIPFGDDSFFDRVRNALAVWYQWTPVELGLGAVLLLHVVLSARAATTRAAAAVTGARKRGQEGAGSWTTWARGFVSGRDGETRAIRLAGWYVALVIGVHVHATRISPLLHFASRWPDAHRFAFTQFSMLATPFPLIPHYVLLGSLGFLHMAGASVTAATRLHLISPAAGRRAHSYIPLLSGLETALLLYALFLMYRAPHDDTHDEVFADELVANLPSVLTGHLARPPAE